MTTTAEPAGCTFCGIVEGTVPAQVIYADDRTVAFLDTAPASDGHTLVVPKQHAADLFSISPDDAAAVMRTAKLMACRIDEKLAPDGLTVVQTNRSAGWQDVFHLHLHLVPRWVGDTLKQPWEPRPAQAERLSTVADKLRG